MKHITSNTLPLGTEIHAFERAGLGLAPYTFVGLEKRTYQACYGAPTQPGASCMFCATGIVYLFWLRSADGKKFFVGSDCIQKSGDAGLQRVIDPYVKAHEKEIREERENFYIGEFAKYVTETNYFATPALLNTPHPSRYYASLGRTLGDYQKFCYDHSGKSAKAKMARRILIEAGRVKPHQRNAKRESADVLSGAAVPEGAILVRKTLFKIIAEAANEDLFVL